MLAPAPTAPAAAPGLSLDVPVSIRGLRNARLERALKQLVAGALQQHVAAACEQQLLQLQLQPAPPPTLGGCLAELQVLLARHALALPLLPPARLASRQGRRAPREHPDAAATRQQRALAPHVPLAPLPAGGGSLVGGLGAHPVGVRATRGAPLPAYALSGGIVAGGQ